MAVTFLVTTTTAHAYTIDKCRFAGSAPTIQYQFFVIGPQWRAAHIEAANRWSARVGPDFVEGQHPLSINILVFDGHLDQSQAPPGGAVVGRMYGDCDVDSDFIWWHQLPVIGYDIRFIPMEFERRVAIAAHELGHALGLGHSGTGCANPGQYRVMDSNATRAIVECGITNPPWSDDIAGVDAIYDN